MGDAGSSPAPASKHKNSTPTKPNTKTMEKKQTPIEWLLCEILFNDSGNVPGFVYEYIEIAKIIEKEQLNEIYDHSFQKTYN